MAASSRSRKAAPPRRGCASRGGPSPAFLVLLVIGFFVAKAAIDSYLRSDGFRRFVAEKAGGTLHADAELAPLHFSGMNIFADRLPRPRRTGSRLRRPATRASARRDQPAAVLRQGVAGRAGRRPAPARESRWPARRSPGRAHGQSPRRAQNRKRMPKSTGGCRTAWKSAAR